jgi:hypothetical protein
MKYKYQRIPSLSKVNKFIEIIFYLKLQTIKAQMQTLQAQKNSVSVVYSNVASRIDTVLIFIILVEYFYLV